MRRLFVWHPGRPDDGGSGRVRERPSGKRSGREKRRVALPDNRSETQWSPHGRFLAVFAGSFPQDRTWAGRVQDGVRKSFRFAGGQNQHGAFFNRPFRRGLGTMQDKVRHRATLQIRCALNEALLFLIEAGVKAIRFGRRRSLLPLPGSWDGLWHSTISTNSVR